MKKAYLKPNMELVEEELAQILCISTVIEPDKPNKPAGVREFDWDDWDDEEESSSRSRSIWDEE